ncbi:hypothetical protein L916_01878 [Phytophthora nicotianae]|uniref:Uncharacterized protein n=1 Tax=Phytophthora nicotianae TaxID=4792 RepID=W2JS89_PHYNI|nr:hypothetical protein L916_01878 [Phytophthora nicotianae]
MTITTHTANSPVFTWVSASFSVGTLSITECPMMS